VLLQEEPWHSFPGALGESRIKIKEHYVDLLFVCAESLLRQMRERKSHHRRLQDDA
jgi:hypothetical protein